MTGFFIKKNPTSLKLTGYTYSDSALMQTMAISHAALLLALACAPYAGCEAQGVANGRSEQNRAPVQAINQASGPAAIAPPIGPSSFLQASLDVLQRTVGELNLEKWKKGNVREEAAANLQSITRNLQSTLPPLLAAADSAPSTVSSALPVSRNIDALYAVLLRVVDGARIAAPDDQFTSLQNAMAGLEKARQSLNDHIQEIAATEEKQVVELHAALKSQAVPVCPVTPAPAVSAPPSPAKKVVKKKKPAVAPKPPAASPSGAAKPGN